MRSLAVDTRYISLGSLMYISVEHPLNSQRIDRAVIAQDTGGAISGGLRADIYAGDDAAAEALAGHMNKPGFFWILKPRQADS